MWEETHDSFCRGVKNARIALKIFLCTSRKAFYNVCKFCDDPIGSFWVLRVRTESVSHVLSALIIYPPFNANVKTNVGEQFLRLIDRYIPKEYRKLFNRQNVKVSYCTMPNMAEIVQSHNARVLANLQLHTKICTTAWPLPPERCMSHRTRRLQGYSVSTPEERHALHRTCWQHLQRAALRSHLWLPQQKDSYRTIQVHMAVEGRKSRAQCHMADPQEGLPIPLRLTALWPLFIGKASDSPSRPCDFPQQKIGTR